MITFNIIAAPPPDAVNDNYGSVGNVGINVSAANGVLGNDTLNGATITASDTSSTGGGTVAVNNADGSFTYNPAPGFEGSDTFTYTLTNGGGSDVGTVTIMVSEVIWFIDNSAGGNNAGTLQHPFTSTAAYNSSGLPQADDHIYLAETGTNYAAGLTLLNNQRLIGEGAVGTLAGLTGITLPTHSNTLPALGAALNPTIGGGTGVAVFLASTNTVIGVDLTSTGVGLGLFGSSFGTATISDVSISSVGGRAINLQNGNGTFAFTTVSANGGPQGIALTNVSATSFTVNGDGTMTAGGNASGGTIQNTTSDGIFLSGVSNVTLRNMTITNPVGHGINADNLTGVNLFQSLTVQNFDTLNTDGITVDQTVNFTSITLDKSHIFDDNGAAHTGNDGFRFTAVAGNSAAGTVNVTASEFNALDGDGIQINNDGSGTINTTITGNNLHDADAVGGGNLNTLNVAQTGNGVLNATIGGPGALGNTLNNVALLSANAGALSVSAGGAATGGATDLNAVIENNTITNTLRRGIYVQLEASGVADHTLGHDITIKDNNIQATTNREGIRVDVTGLGGDDNLNVDLTITGNLVGTVTPVGNNTRPGIYVFAFDDNVNAGTNLEVDLLLQNNQVRVNNTGNVARIFVASGIAGGTANVEATVFGNTFTNDNASGTGLHAAAGFAAPGVNTLSLDLNSANVPANANTSNRGYILNHDKSSNAATDFNIEVDGVGLSGAGPFTDAQVETFFGARNTGTVTTPGLPGPDNNDFTGVAAVTQPLLAIAPPTPATVVVSSGDAGSSDGPADSTGQAGGDVQVSPPNTGSGVLTAAELETIVVAAKSRWAASGLSAAQAAAIDSVTVAVADMPGWYLGAASPGLIQIDSNAGGFGWFIDSTPLDDSEFGTTLSATRLGTSPSGAPAGRIDLLTTVMHELGHVVGLDDSYLLADQNDLMYGFATPGERRLPAVGQASGAIAGTIEHEEYLIGPLALGTLPAGKSVQVTFRTTINSLTNGLAPTLSNQGTVSGSNFSNVLTDDPAAGGTADPTTTTLDSLTLGGQIWIEAGTINSVFNSGTDTGANPIALTLFLSDGTTQVATGSTNGSGVYQFTGLLPGDYIVRVDASNFGAAQTLNGMSSISGSTDPDDNVDNDDNGVDNAAPATNGIRSLPITLAYNTETTAGLGNDTNNTLDFGFVNVPQLGALSPTAWTVGQSYTGTIAVTGNSPFSNLQQLNLPLGLTASLSVNTITISGTPTTAGTFNNIQLSVDDAGSNTGTNTYTITINAAPTLGALGVTAWTVNRAYSSTITIADGTPPHGTLTQSNLPAGLLATLSGNTITISGTPTATGTFNNVQIGITDTAGATASGTYTITINAAPTISNLTTPAWTKGKSGFTGTMTISNGTPPHIIVGTPTGVPTGMNLQLVGNTLSFTGTPTAVGVFNGTVTIMDTAGAQVVKNFTITINPPVAFTLAALPSYTVGTAYPAKNLKQTTGGTGAITFQYALSGALPGGMTLVNGVLSGTPTTAKTITITVTATDSVGSVTVKVYTLTGTLGPKRRGL